MIIAEILATPVSAYLMTFDPAFPYVLGLAVIVIGSIPVFFLPETLEDAKAKRSNQQNAIPNESESSEQTHSTHKQAVLQELIRQVREFKDSTHFIWRDLNVSLMIVILCVTVMSKQSTNMVLQYASKKFDWSIARVRNPFIES